MSKNRKVLVVSMAGLFILFISRHAVDVGICAKNAFSCRNFFDYIEHILYFIPIILFFSLVTYFAKESAFYTWWQFSRYAIPVVLVVSVIVSLELHHEPGGWFNMDNETDIMIIALTYLLFILGSIIAIVRGYRK